MNKKRMPHKHESQANTRTHECQTSNHGCRKVIVFRLWPQPKVWMDLALEHLHTLVTLAKHQWWRDLFLRNTPAPWSQQKWLQSAPRQPNSRVSYTGVRCSVAAARTQRARSRAAPNAGRVHTCVMQPKDSAGPRCTQELVCIVLYGEQP